MVETVVRAHHPDKGIIHVPNAPRNGKRPRDGTNCSAQTLTRRYAYRPPTDLCQAASPASTGGRAWQRCRWNTEDTTSTTPLEEKYHHTYGDVSGMSCQLQATLGTTSPGTWIEWTVVPDQVWDSTDTGVIRERDHGETEGNCAKVETVGESTDLCEGTGEGTTGWSAENGPGAEEKDGKNESVGRASSLRMCYRDDLLGARLVHAAVTPEHSPFSGADVEGVQDGCAPWNKAGKHCCACASLTTKYPIVQSIIHHCMLP